MIREFGDWYHDKGDVCLEAFIEGMEYITGTKIKVERKNINSKDLE